MFIYYPIYMDGPIRTKKTIYLQDYTFTNYPDIIIELHDKRGYVDLGDSYYISAAVTNTDMEIRSFTGMINVLNPHRGQIKMTPFASDFSMTGINTITVRCFSNLYSFSFQFTVFVESLSSSLAEILNKPHVNPVLSAKDVIYDNTSSGLSSSNVQDAIDELKSLQQTVERTEVTYILYADKWDNDLYRVEDENIFTDSDVFIGSPPNITQEQYSALAYANIIPATVENGCVVIQALKDIPTIDIPVSVVIKTLKQG